MKKFLIQSVLLLSIIAGGIFLFTAGQKGQKIDLRFLSKQPEVTNLEINGTTIKVEVADTAEKRRKGLGDRGGLEENVGMLFVFQKVDKHLFWMKGVKFPLDFIWIGDETVVDISENIPPPPADVQDSSLPVYSSSTAIDKVLEVNAGTVQRLNIKVGDTIKMKIN